MAHRMTRVKRAFVYAVAAAGLAASSAGAATLNAPLQLGDTFFINSNLIQLSQIRNGARVGGQITYGANDRLGGIATDAAGNLYLAGNPGGTGLTLERVDVGQAASTVLLDATALTGGTILRDLAVAGDGTIYTLYTTGAIDKFAPAGGGTYTRTAVGTLTGYTGGDRGNGHQLSLTADGNYLITSNRDTNSLYSINTGTGAVQTWTVPAGLNGPVTGAALRPAAESVLDLAVGDKVIVPMGRDGLYAVDFNPATGAFPTATPLRLTNDAADTNFFLDAVSFDDQTNLLSSNRDTTTLGSLRQYTRAELTAAYAGTPFSVLTHPAVYTATDARVARDLAGNVPEPSAVALAGLSAAALIARRRRR